MQKKIALLHRYPADRIKETNAAFPYLKAKGIDVLTFKTFDRLGKYGKFWKSLLWIIYAPILVWGKGYDAVYCDDSFPFYPALVKLVSPKSKVVIRLGDLHLMYNYSGWVYKVLHFFEKITWWSVDEIICISDVMAEFVDSQVIHLRGKKCKVVFDPVDPKDFPIPTTAFNLGDVMFHGTLTRNKNVDVFLDAARLLPEVDFTVIGDGPDLKRLIKLAPKNVFFMGWVPFKDIAYMIAGCSIGVALRSNNPGNEYVVTSPFLQYGIMGKPCLVTRRKVFGEYEWQFSEVHELVAKIKYLVDYPQDGEGKKLREYILKNHTAEEKAEEIWQILNE